MAVGDYRTHLPSPSHPFVFQVRERTRSRTRAAVWSITLATEPGTFTHSGALATKVLFSCHWQTVDLKALCFCTLSIGLGRGWRRGGGERKPFIWKPLKTFLIQSDQQNPKVSPNPVSPSVLCLYFLLTFLWKSCVPFTLRNNQSYLFWQQCANICCIKRPTRNQTPMVLSECH